LELAPAWTCPNPSWLLKLIIVPALVRLLLLLLPRKSEAGAAERAWLGRQRPQMLRPMFSGVDIVKHLTEPPTAIMSSKNKWAD
jgi:hypothetical protein